MIESEARSSLTDEKRKNWRKSMADRTFSLEDPPKDGDELNASSNSFSRQDQSTLECRLEHVPFYSSIETNLIDLRQILQRRGLDEKSLQDKEQTIMEHLNNSLKEFVENENKENENLSIRIRSILDESSKLNRLLKLDENQQKIDEEKICLFDQLRLSETLLERINVVLKEKIEQIENLRTKEKVFCEKLNEKAIEFDESQLPYDQRQKIIEENIENLQKIEVERSSKIEKAREEIHRMKIELELNSNYDQPVEDEEIVLLVDGPIDQIELSTRNVERLTKISNELTEIYEKNVDESERLVENVQALYERLNLSGSDKEIQIPLEFAHRPSKMKILKLEIDRCKALRRENMKTYIENIRDEIFAQYEKCFYGREQMESFLPLYSNDFNEQLLEEHEKELEEIQLYYRHNEQLFTNLAHWHETWAEYREFQRQATDPDRFKRRGYSAIQEEKQRKHLEFTLKKLQEAVLQLSKDYEQEFLHPFMVEGVNVQDFFNNEKENYSQEKELEKARKQLARGQTPTSSHVQTTQKRFDMSSKTPGRVQSNLGKENETNAATPFRPMSAVHKR